MATPIRATIIAAATLIVAAVAVAAQSPAAAPTGVSGSAPAPSLDCTNYLMNLSDCLTYVEEGSKLRKPDKGCCPELAGLVDSQPICLCQLLGSSETYGVQIDLNKALKLPTLCAVQTPPVSMCSEVGYPVRLPPSESPSSSMGAAMPLPPGGVPIASSPGPSRSSGNETSSGGIAISQLSFQFQRVGLFAISFLIMPFFY